MHEGSKHLSVHTYVQYKEPQLVMSKMFTIGYKKKKSSKNKWLKNHHHKGIA